MCSNGAAQTGDPRPEFPHPALTRHPLPCEGTVVALEGLVGRIPGFSPGREMRELLG
jgi:hypothetical protein